MFSFDFTALGSNAPPYPAMRVDTGIDLWSVDPGGGDRCRYTLYRDGNAVNPDSSYVSCTILDFEMGSEESGWLDGVLSIALTVLDGSVTLDPHAIAVTALGSGVPLTPRLVPRVRVVAEPPAALLLVLLVVSGAAWLRRRPRVGRVLVPTTSG